MSDEELDLGEVGGEEEEPEGGRRGGGLLAGLLTKLLLWGAVGLGFIILGVTTTVITLNVVGRGRTQAPAPQSAEYQGRPEPLMYYDNIEAIRGVTADENPAVFSVRVSIGYVFDNDVNKELIDRQREIQNIILLYISTKKKRELVPENYARVQEELKDQINRVMATGKIRQVVFREFVVQ